MRKLKCILLMFIGLGTINCFAQTKEAKKAARVAEVRAMVESRNFNFVAQYATPQGGGRRYLTSSYERSVKTDSLMAYLPYFGRVYFDVPYNPTDGGIKFTSVKFTYKVTTRKKGGWDLLIAPADVKYYQRINMYITIDGNATTDFTITNKSFISFDGYIQKNREQQ